MASSGGPTKTYLLTWYGMTDLRAALRLGDSVGPVLSALRTGDYSDVVLLTYTNPAKDQRSLKGSMFAEWEEWVTRPTTDSRQPAGDRVERIVDAVANTSDGHQLFISWLDTSLTALGVIVKLHVIDSELRHLNDTTGIYSAAAAATQLALADPECGAITTYVSPGTPVMAYTWALIARSNPQLEIAVISSSDPRLPPEAIELPRMLLDSTLRAPAGSSSESRRYDLVIHLLGEQTLPVLFGFRQFGAPENRILTSARFEAEARRIARRAGFVGGPIVVADPFRPSDTRKAIVKQIERLPAGTRVGVNMTGGTKLMFAGALSACWELGLEPFYFEVKHHNVIFLRDGAQIPFVGMSEVDDFFDAGNFHSIHQGRWPTSPDAPENRRLLATNELWKRRRVFRDLYRDQEFRFQVDRHAGRHRSDGDSDPPFSLSWGGSEASVTGSAAKLVVQGTELAVPREGFFDYLAGGWLEEYVHSLLRPLEDDGTIHDLRIGLEVGFHTGPASETEDVAQEFDCTFTDGKRLWIVECKAGPVRQEAIQKLENNLKLYGGVAARGMLVSAVPLNKACSQRINVFPAITFVHPDELSTETLARTIRRS